MIQKLYDSKNFSIYKKDSIDKLISEINEILHNKSLEEISSYIHPLIFKKVDDSNSQIYFIYACTNLKSKNINLGEASWLKVKLTAGRIVPSIPMASSAITGFISLQIYPLLFQDIKLDSLNVLNFNLSIPSLIIQKPFEVENFEDENKNGLILKVIPEKSNVWTKLKIKGPMTIKQFEQYLFDKYGVELEGIYTLDEKPIINKNYECKLEEAYFRAKSEDIQNKFNNVIYFSVYGCGKDFDIVKMPIFEYQF